MSINMNNDKVIPNKLPNGADACYEVVAGQEEIYLEETEEELRGILISEDPSTYDQRGTVYTCNDFEVKISMTNADHNPGVAENLDEELGHAAEELIAGDADDPPLSDEAITEMLRVSRLYSSQ